MTSQLVQQDLKKRLNINVKITKLDYTTYYGRYVEGQWDGMAWGFQSGHADELVTKLRQTPDRTEQRAIAKRVADREHDQVLRMWMPYDSGFVLTQPHVRNAASGILRRTDGYGASAIARVWLDK
jgi:ABC-type transport system substrate-binding protein